jgi:predicted RNA-binding protein YlqC (UPF0109 family)
MVEARDEFETTDDAFEDDFEDAEGSEDLGFDTEEALAQVDQSETDASEQLRGLVEWIVFQLVDDTSQVSVTADQRGSSVRVQVRLPEEDLGKVIGRGGRIAKSIRSVLMIVGSRDHLRVSLDIEGQS